MRPPGKQKSSKFMGVVFLIVLGALGVFAYQDMQKNKTSISDSNPETRTLPEKGKKQFLPIRDHPVNGKLLRNKEYLEMLETEIREAKQSIRIIMYVFRIEPNKYGDPAFKLAKLLKKKSQEGVDVSVILSGSDKWPDLEKNNRETARFLRDSGIEAHVRMMPGRIHAKGVLIDGEKLFLGNHNWTWAALEHNEEVSMFFEGKGVKKYVVPKFDHVFQQVREARHR